MPQILLVSSLTVATVAETFKTEDKMNEEVLEPISPLAEATTSVETRDEHGTGVPDSEVRSKKSQSTGPRTAQGKRRSSKNAIKYGFYSREIIQKHIRKEDRREYSEMLVELVKEKNPIGQSELFQVELMADSRHHLKRHVRLTSALQADKASTLMENLFKDSTRQNSEALGDWQCDLPPLDVLEKLRRAEDHILGKYYRAQRELERLQSARTNRDSIESAASSKKHVRRPVAQ